MAAGLALGPAAWAHGDGARPGQLAPSTPPGRGGSPSPAASASTQEPPLAGRQAGEGRARPGRSLTPLEAADSETVDSEAAADGMPPDPDPAEVPAFTPPPGAFPEPGEATRKRQTVDEPDRGPVRDASLGSGIVLVGLGLVFLALRIRRAD
jgi:hypothetical protein